MTARYQRLRDKCARSSRRRRARGRITVELLLNLPIWLLFVLAVVQFGQQSAAVQPVALASREGAAEAAQTASLSSDDAVPDAVLSVVRRQLASARLVCSKIILEHNVGGKPVMLIAGSGPGEPPAAPLPRFGNSVRVTVCVPPTGSIPNLLGKLGLGFGPRALEQSTTFRHQISGSETR